MRDGLRASPLDGHLPHELISLAECLMSPVIMPVGIAARVIPRWQGGLSVIRAIAAICILAGIAGRSIATQCSESAAASSLATPSAR